MPKEKTPETSEDILKAIGEAEVETSTDVEETETEDLLFKSPDDEELEETEELEGEETSEEETETPELEKEEKPDLDPNRFKVIDGKIHAKLIVEGSEEWVPVDKAVEYAQKGRFLERERAKDRGEKPEKFDSEKADKEFTAEVKKHGFVGALGRLFVQGQEQIRTQDIERRKEARAIADSSEWGKEAEYRNLFNTFLDDGMPSDEAGLKVSAKYWEEMAQKGEERGAEKQKGKDAVKMVKGKDVAPDLRESKTEASLMGEYQQALKEKKPTAELLKIMKKAGVQIGQDTI